MRRSPRRSWQRRRRLARRRRGRSPCGRDELTGHRGERVESIRSQVRGGGHQDAQRRGTEGARHHPLSGTRGCLPDESRATEGVPLCEPLRRSPHLAASQRDVHVLKKCTKTSAAGTSSEMGRDRIAPVRRHRVARQLRVDVLTSHRTPCDPPAARRIRRRSIA